MVSAPRCGANRSNEMATYEVDLHGHTWAEALEAFERECRSALSRSGSRAEIRVIHGYGSTGPGGVLRERLRALCPRFQDSFSVLCGEDLDGNPGISVVKILGSFPDPTERLAEDVLEYCRRPRPRARPTADSVATARRRSTRRSDCCDAVDVSAGRATGGVGGSTSPSDAGVCRAGSIGDRSERRSWRSRQRPVQGHAEGFATCRTASVNRPTTSTCRGFLGTSSQDIPIRAPGFRSETSGAHLQLKTRLPDINPMIRRRLFRPPSTSLSALADPAPTRVPTR